MNAIASFWAFLNYVNHLSGTCSDIAGTPARVVYGGNCAQAFVLALLERLAWVINP